MELRLPIWAPARVLVNLTTWAFIFLVPILYWRIFKFRNTQDNIAGTRDKLRIIGHDMWNTHLKGINEAERKRRKRANVLTTKINFFAWTIEVV